MRYGITSLPGRSGQHNGSYICVVGTGSLRTGGIELCIRQLGHLQLDTVRSGVHLVARIALVHIRQRDVLAGHVLHRLGQVSELGALLLVGRGTTIASKLPSLSTAMWVLLPFFRLWPS